MRIELLNVECEFQVPVVFGRRNVYVTTVDTAASTSDMNNIAFRLCAMGYQSIHVTSQRTGNNETKAYPTIRICLLITLTGDCLSRNAQTSYAKCPLWVINPKPSKGKGDDAEYPIRQRSSHSSPVGSNDSHGIYPVFQTKENSYCIPELKFDSGGKPQMQPTIEILDRIRKNSRDNKEEIFTRLYRYLLRPDLYYLAYKNLYANKGAGTKGVNDDTADGFSTVSYTHLRAPRD